MKIILTERQLLQVIKSNRNHIIEQSSVFDIDATPITNVGEKSPFYGALKVKKNDGTFVNVRLLYDTLLNSTKKHVHVVSLEKQKNNNEIKIQTLKRVFTIGKDEIQKFLNFINSNKKSTGDDPIISNAIGSIYAEKL